MKRTAKFIASDDDGNKVELTIKTNFKASNNIMFSSDLKRRFEVLKDDGHSLLRGLFHVSDIKEIK